MGTLSSSPSSHPDLQMPAPDKAVAPTAEKTAAAAPAAAAKDQILDPLKQVQALVEKKIRNLEKRKVSSDRRPALLSLTIPLTG